MRTAFLRARTANTGCIRELIEYPQNPAAGRVFDRAAVELVRSGPVLGDVHELWLLQGVLDEQVPCPVMLVHLGAEIVMDCRLRLPILALLGLPEHT